VKCRNGIDVFAVLIDEDEGLGENLETRYIALHNAARRNLIRLVRRSLSYLWEQLIIG
jgi:hypothetical protein